MVAVSSQNRIDSFMRSAGLEAYLLDAFDADLGTKVFERVRYLLDHAGQVRDFFGTARRRMRDETAAFNRRVASLLPAS